MIKNFINSLIAYFVFVYISGSFNIATWGILLIVGAFSFALILTGGLSLITPFRDELGLHGPVLWTAPIISLIISSGLYFVLFHSFLPNNTTSKGFLVVSTLLLSLVFFVAHVPTRKLK